MARGNRYKGGEANTKLPDDIDYLTYNTWSILHSAQWVLKYLYAVIGIHIYIHNNFTGHVNINDALELFKALEALYAFAEDKNRVNRAKFTEKEKQSE